MNDQEADNVLKSMISFIKSHGDERVATINKQAQDEYTIQFEKYVGEEKDQLKEYYRNKLA